MPLFRLLIEVIPFASVHVWVNRGETVVVVKYGNYHILMPVELIGLQSIMQIVVFCPISNYRMALGRIQFLNVHILQCSHLLFLIDSSNTQQIHWLLIFSILGIEFILLIPVGDTASIASIGLLLIDRAQAVLNVVVGLLDCEALLGVVGLLLFLLPR